MLATANGFPHTARRLSPESAAEFDAEIGLSQKWIFLSRHGLVRPMEPIQARTFRYIKLGPKNAWAREALLRGRMPFGGPADRHDLAQAHAWDDLVAHYQGLKGATLGKARDFTREVRDFYTLGADCLWITFSDGKLWWAFAEPTVIWPAGDSVSGGDRYRTVVDGWSDKNVKGEPLRISDLSTRLTKVSAYQQTICDVKEGEYLLRRLNAEVEPAVAQAIDARAAVIDAATNLIALLHQNDFEVMSDLIFTRDGWRRSSVLGKTQADIDLALEHPTTKERAFVQVKSAANQAVLDDYIARFEADATFDRFFFLCHSPRGALTTRSKPRMHVWSGETLAAAAIDAGLLNWLIQKNS